MARSTVGEVIRQIRKSKGITATFMAHKLGYKSVSSYTRIETSGSGPGFELAHKIADLLTVDANDFLCNKNLRDSSKNEVDEKISDESFCV